MSVLHAPTKRLTVQEYEELGRNGFFRPGERVELLHGRIIPMSPIGIRHFTAVNRLIKFFVRRSADRFDVSAQHPYNLDEDSQPEPDVTLIDVACDHAPRLPEVRDVFLVIEVADSSLPYDRKQKGPAYGGQGTREYWIFNLNQNCLEVYREPQPGGYASKQIFGPDETVAPLAFPDLILRVGDFLP